MYGIAEVTPSKTAEDKGAAHAPQQAPGAQRAEGAAPLPPKANHKQSQLLKNELKRQIRSRGFCYSDVASHLGVSVITIKRHLNRDRVPIETMEDICSFLGLSLMDLAEIANNRESGYGRRLDPAQEDALSSDHALGLVRFLLYCGWTADEIQAEYDLDEPVIVHLLTRLDRLKLIELQPGNRVRIRGARTIDWRPGGSMRREIEKDIRNNFVSMPFADTEEFFGYETAQLSVASRLQVEDMMRQLVRTMRLLHEVDRNVPSESKQWTTLLVAKRENLWHFPTADGRFCAPRSAGGGRYGRTPN